MKGLATRNKHVQYESFILDGLKVMAKVKVFVHATDADTDGRTMTLAPQTYLSRLAKKIITVISFHLILNIINMSLNVFDINVANGVAIDVANDILPVWWMEVYPFSF